jgi:hypothetical protein
VLRGQVQKLKIDAGISSKAKRLLAKIDTK